MACDAAVSLLGIYPKEYKSGYNKGSCTLIFIAALFTNPPLLLFLNSVRECGLKVTHHA
jgi:hypothetical protein